MTDVDITEDAVDTQALQAQIDLSMSFAQNLVSSWMKPHKLSTNSQKKDIENELKEYMRRPPRLGVGAPIPETSSLHREAARLKGKLMGSSSKRQREDADEVKKYDSDEEESRAGAIKKKPRIDPYASPQGKRKKQKIGESNNTAFSSLTLESAPASLKMLSDTGGNASEDCSSPLLSPRLKKKKNKNAKNAALDSVSLDVSNITSTPSKVLTPNRKALELPGDVLPNTPMMVDVSLTPTPASSIPQKKHLAVLLQRPLLNLDGLHVDVESDNDSKYSTPAGTPKKKRKRRKKKKHLLSQDPVIEPASNLF